MAIEVTERTEGASRIATGIIDCDVHTALASPAALKPYLASRWYPYYEQGSHIGGTSHGGQVAGARPARDIYRRDSRPATGTPGSDYELLREQLLDRHNVARAVLTPLDSVGWRGYGEVAAALIGALNAWLVAEWLERDSRLFGAISIPTEDGVAAAAEIDRDAANLRFAGVLLPIETREGLGHQKYWPIFEAAEGHDLPIVLHVGGFSGVRYATGWPEYAIEGRTGITQTYQAQVTSLVYNAVFDRFPKLRFSLEEGGVAWMASLMWRLDRTWHSTRAHEPHLERLPSEIVREHFWLSTQPFDDPQDSQSLLQMLEHIGMSDKLMYASDYPHWDFDDPDRILPVSLIGKELREQIFRHNAEDCFRFPDA